MTSKITFTIGREKHVLPIDSSKTLRVGSVSPSVEMEVEEVAMSDIDKANHELNAILLPVNNALGDRIVIAWLKLHMAWAQDAYDNAIHEEDKTAALADLHAFSQVLNYAGGELYD